MPRNKIISAISSTQEASLPANIRRSRAMCIVSEQNPKCADPSIMHLLSRLCSPSALIVNKMENYVFCFKHGCDNGFMQTYVWQKKYFCSLPLAICIVGAGTAELLINADQNPQCGNNRPKTLHCLHFPRARSHCRWVHSLQPYL